jgi:hypothetical protein
VKKIHTIGGTSHIFRKVVEGFIFSQKLTSMVKNTIEALAVDNTLGNIYVKGIRALMSEYKDRYKFIPKFLKSRTLKEA